MAQGTPNVAECIPAGLRLVEHRGSYRRQERQGPGLHPLPSTSSQSGQVVGFRELRPGSPVRADHVGRPGIDPRRWPGRSQYGHPYR